MRQGDTIAAIITPPGTGAVGVVRISGPDAVAVASGLFRSNTGRPLDSLSGYSGTLGRVFDADGDIDEAIVFVYRAPKSYTGENIVEISCHGGTWAVQTTLRLCIENGARPAGPGEFTKRAFLNGKLALSQAEAVMDLIHAQGEAAMRAALAVRDGALSTAVGEMVEKLTRVSAHLAAWSDYPEEEIEPVDPAALLCELCGLSGQVEKYRKSYGRGRLLREGISTAIVGRPNAGKSTLMNLLSGAQRSIVADLPGTTRDVVEDAVQVGGYILRLYDTAGIRDTSDPVEQAGVERAVRQLQTADLILAVFDASLPFSEQDAQLLTRLEGTNCIAVINKTDLPQRLETQWITAQIPRTVYIAAKTGEGRELLEKQILDSLQLLPAGGGSAQFAVNERQRACLDQAATSLHEAEDALRSQVTLDAVGVCIDCALEALLSLTGRRVTDQVVDEVFSRFCVGK